MEHSTIELELIRPAPPYAEQVMAYKTEMLANGDTLDGCAALEDCESYAEWSDFAHRLKAKYREQYVPSEVFLAIRKADRRLVGIIDYRHPLSGFLAKFGGNIGYSVRPCERGNGYAAQMLRLMLDIARQHGEEKVLITCDKGNIASEKTIRACGGVLESEIADTAGLSASGVIQRYWITLSRKRLCEMTLEELWRLFPIQLTAPNPRWTADYAEMSQRLSALLGDLSPRLSHIGSTAIPGIWAKPIVDVLAAFDTTQALNAAADRLAANGFLLMSRTQSRISLNLGYTDEGFADKVYHVHLRLLDDQDEVYFRDYLNAHPDTAKAYETLKLGLWKQYEFNRDGYTQAKTAFIQACTETAKRISALRKRLASSDVRDGYAALKELESLCDESDALFPYAQDFARMAVGDDYAQRVRGFRLLCRLAKWDRDGAIRRYIAASLSILSDPRPTAVRQALVALPQALAVQPDLRETVLHAAREIDCAQYAPSMRGLIEKDIQKLIGEE